VGLSDNDIIVLLQASPVGRRLMPAAAALLLLAALLTATPADAQKKPMPPSCPMGGGPPNCEASGPSCYCYDRVGTFTAACVVGFHGENFSVTSSCAA